MNKELQDKAWSVLPKEFKEEVKKLYVETEVELSKKKGSTDNLTQQLRGMNRQLAYLFGHDNLTSDSEGEEMLTVPRKKVQDMYAEIINDIRDYNGENPEMVGTTDPILRERTAGMKAQLRRLFGSKCLPDLSEVKRTLSENLSEQKPAEPKFKIGDKVKHSAHPHDDGIYRVDDIKKSSDGFIYHIQGLIGISNVKESDLEPYIEPEEKSRNLSQETANCDKHFDNILKDSFRNERRLNIAVQLASAMMPKYQDDGDGIGLSVLNEKDMIKCAYRLADYLIAECELTKKLKGE